MKRRFFECALLLGIVMSVMFLAQTPDGIGHDASEGHKDESHTHNPSTNVDPETGEPVTSGGCDPRGNHYSGKNGNIWNGYQHAWGFRYGVGTYSTSPRGPDYDTENVWYLRVDAVASTGSMEASVSVTPSIYLEHFDKKEASWQGSARGRVKFSNVCFHWDVFWKCYEHNLEGNKWEATGFLDLKVKDEEIQEGNKKEYGGGFEGHGVKLTANSEDSYTTKYDELRARGYRFLLKLKGGFLSQFQDKWADGNGQLAGGDVQSGTARAAYKFTDWKRCYCGESKKPDL
ncbi:hypothetical protein C6501_04480 [Candidatus Poribacteria bacterium]|nr:MAG: hypothetical protein C6501_04480 [Candidatus Poribacteria bacterium]